MIKQTLHKMWGLVDKIGLKNVFCDPQPVYLIIGEAVLMGDEKTKNSEKTLSLNMNFKNEVRCMSVVDSGGGGRGALSFYQRKMAFSGLINWTLDKLHWQVFWHQPRLQLQTSKLRALIICQNWLVRSARSQMQHISAAQHRPFSGQTDPALQ